MITNYSKDEILDYLSDKSGLIYFYSNTCGPCLLVDHVLRKVEKIFNVQIFKMNSDEEKNIQWVNELKITQIPVVFVVKEGQLLSKVVGWTKESDYIDLVKMHI